MSRLDDLIAALCPDGVEYRPLGEVGEVIRGRRFTKADYVDIGLESIHYGEIYTTYGLSATEAVSHVRPELKDKLRLAEPGDLIIAATGENAEDLCKAVAWLGNGPVAVHDDCFILRHGLEPKYAAYCFRTAAFQRQKSAYVSEAKVSRVSGRDLAQIRVPVPPMEVQREIVTILDRFTELEVELEADLEAELEARRRQYEHHREGLLRPRQGDSIATLGEIFDMRSGRFVAASNIAPHPDVDHPIPCYGGNGRRGYVHTASHSGDLLLVGRQGALSGNVHRVQGPVYATEHAVVTQPGASVDIAWAFHKLTAMNLNQYVSQGAQPGLAVGTLRALEIAIPPIEAQREVAATLIEVDALVNDLSVGLSAEIAARKKQYQHYRDRLLTFKELVG